MLINSAGGFFGFITNAYVSDAIGRRRVFRLFGAGFIVTATFYLYAPLGDNAALLALAGFVYGFFQFGMYASFGAYFTELFPTEQRGAAFAWSNNLLGRIGYWLSPFVIGQLVKPLGWGPVLRATAVFPVVAIVLIWVLLPETKGRELESTAEVRS